MRTTRSPDRAGRGRLAWLQLGLALTLALPACSQAGAGAFPPTKLALIMAVDEALRARDVRRLHALWAPEALIGELCAGADPEARAGLGARLRERRQAAEAAFAECLALGDFSRAERLALNYGARVSPGAACPAWRTHESSELFYGLDGAVYKVSLRGMLDLGDRHLLGGSLRCSRKGGSAADFRGGLAQLVGQRCPDQPWPLLTQVRGPCPRLTR